jgi:membrane protein implicated in regulation of membrane protease activity
VAGIDSDLITLAWLILGILLMVGEVVSPGLVAVFLGAAAVLVAGLRYVGLIEGLAASIFAWMGLSIGLTVTLRRYARRYLPAETSRGQIDEGVQALGQVVEVTADVNDSDDTGRIRYQGTSWPAISTEGVIPKGAQAQLVARQNLAWIVEPLRQLPDGISDEIGD